MFNDVGSLIYITHTDDSDGYPIEVEEKTEVYLNKKSVARQEFYLAMQTGFKPTITFELRIDDYELTKHIVNNKPIYATKIEYDSCIYDIIRTYTKNESMIELTCG